MPNLAAALKDEIRRLARKEIRAQVGTTKQAASQHRHEIAKLKQHLKAQDRKIGYLESRERKRLTGSDKQSAVEPGTRFSARSVKAQRRRLKLSAKDYGKLVGVSGQTIYLWEQGKTRPRASQLAALAAVRGLGKREAMKRLEVLGAKPAPVRRRRKR